MYSVILMASLATPADVPQGLIFHRGAKATGCAGTAYAAPPAERSVYHAPAPVRGVFARLGERLHERPQRGVFVATAPRLSHGCAGSTISVAAMPRATGCSGGTMTLVGPVAQGPVAPATMAAHANLTPEQNAARLRALDDPGVYEATVTKVTNDLVAKGRPIQRLIIHRKLRVALEQGPAAMGTAEARFDGHVLQMLLDNLPKILDAVIQIIKFIDSLKGSIGFVSPHPGGWRAMPVGPWPLPRVVPPPVAWNAC